MATVENMTITVTIEQPSLRLNEVAAEQITQEDIIIFGRWMKGDTGDTGPQGPPGPEYDDTEIRQEIAAKYTKPGTGIPATDMSEGVRTSLGKADTALQTHQDISGKQDKSSLEIDVAALGFVVKSVNDLANYYLKSDTYTKTEVQQLIGTIQGFHYEIAASTSEVTDPQSNVLYLIGPTGSGADKYEEYVYSNSTWVKIGDTSIDLSGYVTTGDLSTALSYYTTTANLSLLLDAKQNKIDSGHKLDYSLIENTPDIPENVVLYTEQTLSDEQKAQVRSNIGAGESGFSGDYNDLTNKPTLGTAAAKDVPASGNATTTQVVKGDDSRLSDSRNAADVYPWAKAATKPSYSASEVGAIPSTDKGANGGVAELDSNGKVPSSQLPSYVDDVLEYPSLSAFPSTGESGKIYIAQDNNKTYRWSGSTYAEISESLALGETSSTAYRGDRGKTAYDHSQVTDGSNPHNTTFANIASKPTTIAGYGITDAFSGNYNDLSNKPTIPTKISDLTNDSDFIETSSTAGLVKNDGTIDTNTYLTQHQDITGKADKVTNATNGNFAAIDSNGNLTDSGHKHSDYLTSQTNADWNASSGAAEILNKPTIPDAVSGVNDGTNWTSITIGSVTKGIPTGGGGGAQIQSDWTQTDTSAVDYIKNKPSIPSATSDLNNDSGFITSNDIPAQVQSDWNEADNTKPEYIANKPTIPTVNNATLTIQKNSATIGTFSANASSDNTINITVPTSASDVGAIPTTSKGANGGVAELDSSGKVPSSQLPSYVDDVVEAYYNTTDHKMYEESTYTTEITPTSGKIYVDLLTNKTYRWGGSSYTEISESLALGTTSTTAYRGDLGAANASAITAIKDGTTIDSFGDVETALSGKQATIDSSHKLSSDLISDGSTNKVYTATEQTKLSGIETGAQVNVKPDWNAASGAASEILNKPTIPAAQVNSDWNASSGKAQILNKPTIPSSINDLSDVNISSPVDGQVLAYNTTTGKLENVSLPIVTSISSSSTDAQVPSAKCMYDIIGDVETLLADLL